MKEGNIPNLDDINQTAFCIPFNGEEKSDVPDKLTAPSGFESRDLEGGEELRFAAYRAAWRKCFDQVQKIIREFQVSSVETVVREVQGSYTNILPGLPYPELPVVSIINPSLGATYLDEITSRLVKKTPLSDPDELMQSCVIHLYPGDFSNITTAMRSITLNFLDKLDTVERGKHKPATSLANYDIKLLVAWWKSEMIRQTSQWNLVAVLHDFEQYEPSVMQDVFYIFSQQVAHLPIVFLLSMSSPSSTYLNDTYTRATMSVLRVRTFTAPSGPAILQEVFLKVFFSLEFEPDIMIGPATLEYLQDYFTRYHSSADAIYSILQLAYMNHFNSEPLTVLARRTPSLHVLSQETSSAFVESVLTRLITSGDNVDLTMVGLSKLVIPKIEDARHGFHTRSRNLRIGFNLMVCIQEFFESWAFKGLPDWSSRPGSNQIGGTFFRAMLNVLRGNVGDDIEQISKITRNLKREEVASLLEAMHNFFFTMPVAISAREHEARLPLILIKTRHSSSRSRDDLEVTQRISDDLSDWLREYLESKLVPLEECVLWDIWYTGLSPFPSEILNPSLRASMMAGLLRPHDFALDFTTVMNTDLPAKAIWELPDTSILFKRYLDSGKMINVYDWFESFKTVVDSRREHLKEVTSPPKKPRKGIKAKKHVRDSEEATAEDEEKWNIEVQARFIRAMHELDYLGFIKHTGRKADHVLRTVFDIDDAE